MAGSGKRGTGWAVRLVVLLLSASIGLLVAALVLPGMHLTVAGFVITVVAFAVLQTLFVGVARALRIVLGPFSLLAIVVATVVALVIAGNVGGGLRMDGWLTWLVAGLLIWAVAALSSAVVGRLLARTRRDAS